MENKHLSALRTQNKHELRSITSQNINQGQIEHQSEEKSTIDQNISSADEVRVENQQMFCEEILLDSFKRSHHQAEAALILDYSLTDNRNDTRFRITPNHACQHRSKENEVELVKINKEQQENLLKKEEKIQLLKIERVQLKKDLKFYCQKLIKKEECNQNSKRYKEEFMNEVKEIYDKKEAFLKRESEQVIKDLNEKAIELKRQMQSSKFEYDSTIQVINYEVHKLKKQLEDKNNALEGQQNEIGLLKDERSQLKIQNIQKEEISKIQIYEIRESYMKDVKETMKQNERELVKMKQLCSERERSVIYLEQQIILEAEKQKEQEQKYQKEKSMNQDIILELQQTREHLEQKDTQLKLVQEQLEEKQEGMNALFLQMKQLKLYSEMEIDKWCSKKSIEQVQKCQEIQKLKVQYNYLQNQHTILLSENESQKQQVIIVSNENNKLLKKIAEMNDEINQLNNNMEEQLSKNEKERRQMRENTQELQREIEHTKIQIEKEKKTKVLIEQDNVKLQHDAYILFDQKNLFQEQIRQMEEQWQALRMETQTTENRVIKDQQQIILSMKYQINMLTNQQIMMNAQLNQSSRSELTAIHSVKFSSLNKQLNRSLDIIRENDQLNKKSMNKCKYFFKNNKFY